MSFALSGRSHSSNSSQKMSVTNRLKTGVASSSSYPLSHPSPPFDEHHNIPSVGCGGSDDGGGKMVAATMKTPPAAVSASGGKKPPTVPDEPYDCCPLCGFQVFPLPSHLPSPSPLKRRPHHLGPDEVSPGTASTSASASKSSSSSSSSWTSTTSSHGGDSRRNTSILPGVCWVCIQTETSIQQQEQEGLDAVLVSPSPSSSSLSAAPSSRHLLSNLRLPLRDDVVHATADRPTHASLSRLETVRDDYNGLYGELFHDDLHASFPGCGWEDESHHLDYHHYHNVHHADERQQQRPHHHHAVADNVNINRAPLTTSKSPPSSPSRTDVVYIGDYNSLGQRHGDHGELLWENGDRYVGSFVNGLRQGQGTLFFRDASEYTGDWFGNKMHGSGQRTFANGDIYVGLYTHGQRCGPKGKLKFANGDLYVGGWEADQFHGPGRYFFADGTALEGTFHRGTKEGKFKRQLPNGELDILRFEDDQVVGSGVRWNVARNKTWLLRTVATRNKIPKKSTPPTGARTDPPTSPSSKGGRRRPVRRGSAPGNLTGIISQHDEHDPHHHHHRGNHKFHHQSNSFPPDRPIDCHDDNVRPVVTVTKKTMRIPIAQAVSIGYECEMGRTTNPVFWTVGTVMTDGFRRRRRRHDCDDSGGTGTGGTDA